MTVPSHIKGFCNFLIDTQIKNIKLLHYVMYLSKILTKNTDDKEIKNYIKDYKRYLNYVKSKVIQNINKETYDFSDSSDSYDSDESDGNDFYIKSNVDKMMDIKYNFSI